MANYSLVVGSRFSPFTYEELIKPALMATQAHQELEDQYADLTTKASVWEEMANEESDPYAYKMYQQYANDLKSQADLLASQGLTSGSRRALLDMKGRYSKEITPIEQAYTTRQKFIDQQREALLKDNTMMFDIDASAMSLDDLIRNPQMSYKNYSGATLASQVGSAAKALSEQMRTNPREWRNILGDQYFETIMQKGYRPDEIIKVLSTTDKGSAVLRGIIDNVIDSSGIASWGDANTLKRAYDYAGQGLWEAVGKTEYQHLANKAYDYAMEEAAQIRKEQREAARKAREAAAQQLKMLGINPSNIYSAREQEAAAANINEFSKYFTKNAKGETVLTEEGMKEYRRNAHRSQSASGTGYSVPAPPKHFTDEQKEAYYKSVVGDTFEETPFRKFLTQLGVDEANAEIDNWNPKAIGEVWDKYIIDNDTSLYDASKVTEYESAIDSEDREDVKLALLNAIRVTGKLEEVDYDNKSNKFEPTGKELSAADLNKNDYEVIKRTMSPYGATVLIKDKDGKVRRYRMPSVHRYFETFRDAELSKVANIQRQLMSEDLTPEEEAALNAEYIIALNTAKSYDAQIFYTDKMTPQTFSVTAQ